MVRSSNSCNYLASRLALSPNGPKRASTWASSPRSIIGCIQNNFWAYGTFGANRAPILHDTNTISKWTGTRFHMIHVTSEFHQVRPKWFPSLWYVRRKLCIYVASKLALSPNILKLASAWASSPRSTIGCGHNNFWAYGTFGANRARILHRH
jgi:hypothetical protein